VGAYWGENGGEDDSSSLKGALQARNDKAGVGGFGVVERWRKRRGVVRGGVVRGGVVQ
jgi:hypothetical protein